MLLSLFFSPLQGTLSIHPTGGTVHSGTNLLISGLCYRPGAEVRCDFGELGTVAGRKINETKAVCSVPLTTATKEVTLFVYSSADDNLKFAQLFQLGKNSNLSQYGSFLNIYIIKKNMANSLTKYLYLTHVKHMYRIVSKILNIVIL